MRRVQRCVRNCVTKMAMKRGTRNAPPPSEQGVAVTNEKVIQLAKKAGLLAPHDQWLWSERRLLQFAELVEDEALRERQRAPGRLSNWERA